MYKSTQDEGEETPSSTNPEKRWRLQKAGKPERGFYTDEHPEIPKIRRASRSINQGTGSHPSVRTDSQSLPAVEAEDEEIKRSTTRGTKRIATPRQEENEDETPTGATSTLKKNNPYRPSSVDDDEPPLQGTATLRKNNPYRQSPADDDEPSPQGTSALKKNNPYRQSPADDDESSPRGTSALKKNNPYRQPAVDDDEPSPRGTSALKKGNPYRQLPADDDDEQPAEPYSDDNQDRPRPTQARSYGHGSRVARLRPVRETLEHDPAAARRNRYIDAEEEYDDYYAGKRRPIWPTTSDMAPGRYHRQTIRVRRVQQRTRNAIHDQFQAIKQNRKTLIVLAIIAAVLIISVPLLTNLLQKQIPGGITTLKATNGSAAITSIQNATQPTNPHELVITPAGGNHPAPPVYASAAYLLDANTGATLYAYNPFVHLPIMSTTKLMTALIAVQQGNLNKKITVTSSIQNDLNQLAADSSLMGIKANETYTLNDLLHGLLLMSGNDAAVVIADGLAGNQTKFVAEMNQKAQQMGLHDTHFENPHGLLENGHYSSAHDLAILAKNSLGNSTIQQITDTKVYQLPATSTHHAITMSNSDQFLWWYPGVNAGKTGWDDAANFVQVVSVVRNNHHLIGVVIHTRDWWTDMRDLMNWGFNNFTWISPKDINANDHAIPFAADWNYFESDNKTNTIPTTNGGEYYIYTGYEITGPIMSFFNSKGGLTKIGYPTGPQIASGTTKVSQQFQHDTITCTLQTKQCELT